MIEADQSRAFTADELARCAEREVRQRSVVYPRLVAKGSMRNWAADREIAMMLEIAQRLRAQAEADPQESGRLL